MSDNQQKKQEATARDFLNVIFRRKFIILAIVGVTAAVVVYLKASQPLTYVSSSRLLVKRGQQQNSFAPRPMYLPWAEEVSSQIELILSDPVFTRAKQIFADSTVARNLPHLRFNSGSVRADVKGESNVFIISYGSANPDECVLGTTAMTEAYVDYYLEFAAPPQVSEFFQSSIDEVLKNLESWRVKKREFLRSANYMGADDESSVHIFKLARLELTLSELATELSSQRIRVQKLQEVLDLSPGELEKNMVLNVHRSDLQTGLMANIKTGLQQLRMEREDLLNKFTINHPEVVSKDNQIRDLQINLQREVKNACEVEKSRYQESLAKHASVESAVNATKAAINTIPAKEAELSRIENKIAAFQSRYETLIDKQNQGEIAAASRPEWTVKVLSPPSPAWPSRTKDYVRLALGPFLSLIVGLGVAFFFESLDHSLKNAGEVEEYIGAKVLATFAEAKQQK